MVSRSRSNFDQLMNLGTAQYRIRYQLQVMIRSLQIGYLQTALLMICQCFLKTGIQEKCKLVLMLFTRRLLPGKRALRILSMFPIYHVLQFDTNLHPLIPTLQILLSSRNRCTRTKDVVRGSHVGRNPIHTRDPLTISGAGLMQMFLFHTTRAVYHNTLIAFGPSMDCFNDNYIST